MIRTTRAAGTPLKILMFMNTLSAGTFSWPAIDFRTSFIKLSRSAALRLSRRARAESDNGAPRAPGARPGVAVLATDGAAAGVGGALPDGAGGFAAGLVMHDRVITVASANTIDAAEACLVMSCLL